MPSSAFPLSYYLASATLLAFAGLFLVRRLTHLLIALPLADDALGSPHSKPARLLARRILLLARWLHSALLSPWRPTGEAPAKEPVSAGKPRHARRGSDHSTPPPASASPLSAAEMGLAPVRIREESSAPARGSSTAVLHSSTTQRLLSVASGGLPSAAFGSTQALAEGLPDEHSPREQKPFDAATFAEARGTRRPGSPWRTMRAAEAANEELELLSLRHGAALSRATSPVASAPSSPCSPVPDLLLFPGETALRPRAVLSSGADIAFVLSVVPPLLRAESWRLLYSTVRDGTSLSTLLRASAGTKGPSLLLLRETSGAKLGCYTSDPWCLHLAGRSFGTGECFVLRLPSAGSPAVYHWARSGPRVFQTATHEAISLGGAPHFALWIDSELRCGSSGDCATFNSPCLAPNSDFEVSALEVWHFGADGAALARARDAAAAEGRAQRPGGGGLAAG